MVRTATITPKPIGSFRVHRFSASVEIATLLWKPEALHRHARAARLLLTPHCPRSPIRG